MYSEDGIFKNMTTTFFTSPVTTRPFLTDVVSVLWKMIPFHDAWRNQQLIIRTSSEYA